MKMGVSLGISSTLLWAR